MRPFFGAEDRIWKMNIATPAPIDAPCPVCQGPTDTLFQGMYDDRYGYPDLFSLQQCPACGHSHIPAHFKPEDLTRLYTDYYPRGNFDLEGFQPEQERAGFMSWLNGDRGSAFRWVPRNVRVLDIGCGVGQILAYHRNRGCQAVGIEADENVQAIAARYGLDIRRGVFDGTQFDSDFFDYVTLDQVAEHVMDPHALMQGVKRVLKPGGKVVITTPNPKSLGAWLYGRYWLNWHPPYHMQFYTRRSLELVARRAGLSLVKSKTITASDWQFYQWRHVLTFPRRGEKSSFWVPGQVPEIPHKFLDGLVDDARRVRLHRWISRVLDMFGVGDNNVFILQKP
jgi:SAM-dependent methyltransferase